MFSSIIVEDNPVNYMIMRNQMLKLGLAPHILHNGREAMEHCIAKGIPDLILLDGFMPEMDGIAFLKWIRNYPGGDRPYILFCSASVDVIDAAEALRLGADCHRPKPLRPEDMTAMLKALGDRFGPTTAYKQSSTDRR